MGKLPADTAIIEVYDEPSRTKTDIHFRGPLAELMASRCVDLIGSPIVAGRYTSASSDWITVFVPEYGGGNPMEIYEGNLDRRPRDSKRPRLWILEADSQISAEYRERLAETEADASTGPRESS